MSSDESTEGVDRDDELLVWEAEMNVTAHDTIPDMLLVMPVDQHIRVEGIDVA